MGKEMNVGYDYPRSTTVGLPSRPFLYTIDQLSVILAVAEDKVKKRLWYSGREVGAQPRDKLLAINIAEPEEKPEWRVAERELVRWMRRHGIKFYERTVVDTAHR
jgi:hypothetical protein